METGNYHILDLELDRKLALYQEDVLRLKVQAAGRKSQLLHRTNQSLVKDLRHMVNNPKCSDVTFICEDGERVHASRMLLGARSEVLRSLLGNGMAESEQSEVVLPEISSDVFLLVLNFLYTAELWERDLRSSFPQDADRAHHHGLKENDVKLSAFSLDWLFMFRAIKAAQFLLLSELEGMMITRLWVDLPRYIRYTEDVLEQVTQRFTLVCNFLLEVNDWEVDISPSGRHVYLLGLHLLKIMSDHELNVTHLRNLSYQSVFSYLHHTKNHSNDETWTSSFREYIRFWQLMSWWIISTPEINDSYQEASTLWLPEPKRAASLLKNSEKQKQFFLQLPSDVSELREEFAAKIQTEELEALTGMINLVHIHPELLIHVVEPLGVFSSTQLGAVLRDQLVRASRWRKQVESRDRKCSWQVVDAGKIRLITDNRLGSDKLAVANVAMWSQSVYQWEIVHFIEYPHSSSTGPTSCPSFTLEVGFLDLESRETMEDFYLSENVRGWAFRLLKERKVESIKCMFFENGEKRALLNESFASTKNQGTPPEQVTVMGTPSRVSDKHDLKWAIHVRIKLDRLTNSCSFSYKPNGKEYSVVCKNLSRGLLFPAVYVVYDTVSCESETHVKLTEGFELSF